MAGWIVGLLVAGFVLLLAEIIMPGGVVGTLGGLLLVSGVGLSFYQYGVTHGLWILFVTGAGVCAVLYGGLKILPQTRIGRGILLSQTVEGGPRDRAVEEDRRRLVGRGGVALTDLRPAGKGEIDGRRWDVVTDGSYIDKGQAFRVARVEGMRIVVSALEGESVVSV